MSRHINWLNKKFVGATLMAVCGLFLLGAVAKAAERPSQPPVFLVLPFQINEDSALSSSAEKFPDSLADRLAGKGIRSVPHVAMMQLLQQQQVTHIDSATVRSLAQAARATHAIYGNVVHMGDTLSIDARIVDTVSGATSPVYVEKHGITTNINPAIDDLSGRIANIFTKRGSLAGVTVRGTRVLEPEVILTRLHTQKGDAIDFAAIDTEVKRIWELGYFNDVQVEIDNRADGPWLIYTVVEKPKIEAISVEGNTEFNEGSILAAMGSKAGSIVNDKQLAQDIQAILELYRSKGFFQASVQPDIRTRASGDMATVVVKVNEGKEMYIRKLAFSGNSQVSDSELRDDMNISERGIISWITGTGVLKEEMIERDTAVITSVYMNKGFMDVNVGVPTIDYLDDGIAITFPIVEGQRYRIGSVSFEGDLVDTVEKFESITKLHKLAEKNDYFNLSVMQDDARAISDLYADYGYAFADIDPTPRKQGDVVDVAFFVSKREKIYIRRVIAEGNEKTRDNVILREMRLTDSQPFEGYKLRRSMDRLNKLGYFDSVEAEFIPTEYDDEIDLKIKVKEKPTGALMAGVGYSTFANMGVSGTLMEQNLWGKGYKAALQASVSGRREALTLSLTNPRLYDTDWGIGMDVYHWRDDYIDYKKKTTGTQVRAMYPLGEYTGMTFGHRLDMYKLYHLDDDASYLIRKYADGDRISSASFLRVVRDTTDKINPSTGNIDMIGVEYGGGVVGGDDDFIMLTAEHQTYYAITKRHILHARVKGSILFENGSDEVPVFERFWMGGMESVRGYDSRDIVPRDPVGGDRIGGTRMAFANLEYIWNFSEEFGLNLVPFFDVGFNIDADRSYSWSDEIKKSVGLEFRWRSPMGDLRFGYGIPLDDDRKGNREQGRFEFSMGRFF